MLNLFLVIMMNLFIRFNAKDLLFSVNVHVAVLLIAFSAVL